MILYFIEKSIAIATIIKIFLVVIKIELFIGNIEEIFNNIYVKTVREFFNTRGINLSEEREFFCTNSYI